MDFHLPDLGEGLTEAELISWRVSVGDPVELNQIIAEVETAKAAVELPSPFAGTVTALHGAEGDTLAVGAPLISFALAEEPAAAEQPVAEERVPVLVGYGATAGTTSRRRARTAPPRPEPTPTPAPTPAPTPTATAEPTQAPSRPLAKPQVRKLAKDLGVDLTRIAGSGTGGIVTRPDVLAHRPAPPRTDVDTVPVKGVRRATAEAMVRSAFTAPHVTEFITVDVTPTMELLERLKASSFTAGIKLTPLTFVARALLAAVPGNPTLNASWGDEEITLHREVNLGIAAATPRGLLVPNIKNAGALGLFELAQALTALTTTAREGRTTPADLAGGTITITNVGVYGVDTGTPILNPGEAAILCLGAIRQQPWVVDGEIRVRWITTLGLSFDHRVVDGEQGSRFLAAIASTLSTG